MILTNPKIRCFDYSKFVSVLPGNKKVFIDISVITPQQILTKLNLLNKIKFDTLVMFNLDPWLFHADEQMLFDHPALQGKTVIIQTQEYTSKYLGNNHWRVSYPMWYISRPMYKQQFVPHQKNLEYGFGCLNNRPALHRLLLGTELFNRNLLDQIAFVQNNTQSMGDNVFELPAGELDESLIQDPGLLEATPGFNEYKKLLPIKFRGQEIRNTPQVYHYAHLNTYCNITAESVTEMIPYEQNITLPEISEKSPKPFIAGQIPLFLAAPGHNAYFKSLGFELLEDLTPDGFDSMRTVERIRAIADVVALGKEFIEQFYFDHLPQIKHNYELIQNRNTDAILLKRVKDLFQ